MERVLHIGRVIDMNIGNDLDKDHDGMRQIREAIMNRWVNGQRQQQRSISALAGSINDMFQWSPDDLKAIYADAFGLEVHAPIQEAPAHYLWPEVPWQLPYPELTELGVTYVEHDFHVYIYKGDKKYVQLKTPSLVRQIRALRHGL